MKILGEIPARFGSKRVKSKNLKLLDGKPLITYAIEAAKNSKLLNEIYVNSESDIIGEVGIQLGVKYFKRDALLADDHTSSDEFNYDFIIKTKPDILVLINPVCPLIEGVDIDNAISHFISNDLDTLITVREERLQTFCNNEPVNFDINEKLPRTQDISPMQLCVWPICIWRAETFMKSFETKGHAVFSGKVGLYPVPYLKSIKISYNEDFELAEAIIQYKKIEIPEINKMVRLE